MGRANATNLENILLKYAVCLAVSGLGISAVLVIILVGLHWTDAKDISTVVGLFTGVVGTSVGHLLGAHIGSRGLENVRQAHKTLGSKFNQAINELKKHDKDQAYEILQSLIDTGSD